MIGKRNSYSLTFQERQAVKVLVVEPESQLRQVIRNAVNSLGYGSVYCVSEHTLALEKAEQSEFTHVIYDAQSESIDVLGFLDRLFQIHYDLIAVAICENPEVDEVFRHLQSGARGFITKPITTEMVDEAILQATLGQPLSSTILSSNDRNEAFSALLAATLNKAARAKQQAQRSPNARRDAEHYLRDLHDASDLVQTFREGGEAKFLATMINFFVTLADGPMTRLGNLRKRLSNERGRE
jgi:DNA-binding NtrC family response regulator